MGKKHFEQQKLIKDLKNTSRAYWKTKTKRDENDVN
jgi:hypothetical protein